MSKSSNPFYFHFLCPRYWGIWIGYGLLRTFSLLPDRVKFLMGEKIGILLYTLAKSRRQLSLANIQRAFPEKTEPEATVINYEHFKSLGISLIETINNLWGDHRKGKTTLIKHFHFDGLENLAKNPEQGKLLIVPHFTTIEATGLGLSMITDIYPIYRKHDNDLMEYLITSSRTRLTKSEQMPFIAKPIANTETREMIKQLKQKKILMILPDQRFRAKGSIKVPFFGKDAPSNPNVCRLAKLGRAQVLPVFTIRQGHDYHIKIQPALENFPSDDDYQDTLRLHQLYKEEIRKKPAQYLWTHNRWDLKKGRDY